MGPHQGSRESRSIAKQTTKLDWPKTNSWIEKGNIVSRMHFCQIQGIKKKILCGIITSVECDATCPFYSIGSWISSYQLVHVNVHVSAPPQASGPLAQLCEK